MDEITEASSQSGLEIPAATTFRLRTGDLARTPAGRAARVRAFHDERDEALERIAPFDPDVEVLLNDRPLLGELRNGRDPECRPLLSK